MAHNGIKNNWMTLECVWVSEQNLGKKFSYFFQLPVVFKIKLPKYFRGGSRRGNSSVNYKIGINKSGKPPRSDTDQRCQSSLLCFQSLTVYTRVLCVYGCVSAPHTHTFISGRVAIFIFFCGAPFSFIFFAFSTIICMAWELDFCYPPKRGGEEPKPTRKICSSGSVGNIIEK